MAHLIDFSTGRAGMAYVGQTPWHGLGEQLQPGAPLEVWQVQAGMDWQARETALQGTAGAADSPITFASKGLFRSDTLAPLSIVGDNYKVVQPGEVLEFFRDLVAADGFALETAGCLDEGRKFWALARTGQAGRIGANDMINGYLLLASSLDGSMATTAQFTSVRVVCNNTLRVAVADSKGAVKVRHRSVFDASKVKGELGLLPASWDAFMSDAQQLAETPVILHNKAEQKKRITQFLCETFGGDPNKELEEQPNKRAMIRTWELFTDASQNPGADMQSANGTAWGLVNAVTRYVDFERRAMSQSNRLEAAWFGLGADAKSRAWDSALKLAA